MIRRTLFLQLSEAQFTGLRQRRTPPEMAARWRCVLLIKYLTAHYDSQLCVSFFVDQESSRCLSGTITSSLHYHLNLFLKWWTDGGGSLAKLLLFTVCKDNRVFFSHFYNNKLILKKHLKCVLVVSVFRGGGAIRNCCDSHFTLDTSTEIMLLLSLIESFLNFMKLLYFFRSFEHFLLRFNIPVL